MIWGLFQPFLFAIVLAAGPVAVGAGNTQTERCVQIEVKIEGFHGKIKLEKRIVEGRSMVGGGVSRAIRQTTEFPCQTYSFSLATAEVRSNGATARLRLQFKDLDDLGRVRVEGQIDADIDIEEKIVTFSAFDPGVTIKSYIASCAAPQK